MLCYIVITGIFRPISTAICTMRRGLARWGRAILLPTTSSHKKLSIIVKDHVIEKLDHKNLNEDVEFMKGKLCSIENLVIAIWGQLEPALKPTRLTRLRLHETENHYVEYEGK